MRHASASRVLAVAAAACAVVCSSSCVRHSEKWSRGSTGTSEYEKRMDETVRRTYDELSALAAGDESADYTHSRYDKKTTVDTEPSLFGKKKFADKQFRTKDFAGADEYKGKDYHFLKRQDYKEKTSRDQDERFSTGEAREEKRLFFGRNKKARTKEFDENDKLVRTSGYRDTEADLERLEGRDLTIVRDDAAEAEAALTVEDVRTMLHGPAQ